MRCSCASSTLPEASASPLAISVPPMSIPSVSSPISAPEAALTSGRIGLRAGLKGLLGGFVDNGRFDLFGLKPYRNDLAEINRRR
jgi:hypothetical protein